MRTALLLVAALAACGGDDDGAAGIDAGPDDVDAGGDDCEVVPSDITCAGLDGAWVFENLSGTADSISNEGDLAISASGAMMLAFAEPLADPIFDQDIFVASSSECGWEPSAPLTSDSEVQNAFPSLAVEGDTFHLVWSGYPEELNDVYYAANSGRGWSERVNLTAEYESAMMRHAYSPSLSIGPGGEIAIAYLSAPADVDGGFDGPSEVRAAILEADTLAGAPVTVIEAGTDGCVRPHAIHDGDGNLHVLAECGPIFDQDVMWTTDAGPGPWQAAEPLPGNGGHDDLSASVALDGSGAPVAVWAADLSCPDGTCRTILSSVLGGGGWSGPVTVSQDGMPADFSPTVTIGPDGTVYVAFWRDNADAKADVYLTVSADGTEFAPPCNLTRTETENEWMPSSIQLDQAGALHLLYEQFVPGSDPLDTEIIHGFVP